MILHKNIPVWIFFPFPTIHLYEVGFSSYTLTKAKYCKRLNAEADVGIQLSAIELDISRDLQKNVK